MASGQQEDKYMCCHNKTIKFTDKEVEYCGKYNDLEPYCNGCDDYDKLPFSDYQEYLDGISDPRD